VLPEFGNVGSTGSCSVWGGVSVNAIAPGAMETDHGGGAVRDNAEVNAQVAAMTAMGRAGRPDDIGAIMAQWLGPESPWVTGGRMEVSGGMMP
jgi:NAD(P)-dependent dehydrogenase (short-subunit alcohol dehydrogenase family)